MPRLGESPVREISTQAVLSLLQVIEQRTPESAYKSKLIVGQVLRFAIARGDAEIDVTVNLKGALKPRRVGHFGALTAPRDMRYDRCAHTFFSALCLAASLIFYLI